MPSSRASPLSLSRVIAMPDGKHLANNNEAPPTCAWKTPMPASRVETPSSAILQESFRSAAHSVSAANASRSETTFPADEQPLFAPVQREATTSDERDPTHPAGPVAAELPQSGVFKKTLRFPMCNSPRIGIASLREN
jgi:hypothetical protein